MAEKGADLIEAFDKHTDVESAGEGGKDGKVACWLTADAIKNRREDVLDNLTLLANAHGFSYGRSSLESSGCIAVFEPEQGEDDDEFACFDEEDMGKRFPKRYRN